MEFIKALEGWGVPVSILMVVVAIIVLGLVIEAIGKIFGKKIPFCSLLIKPFKVILKKKREQDALLNDMHNTLNQVNTNMPELSNQYEKAIKVIEEFNKHYSKDNINKRDKWILSVNTDMKWAHERAKVYDSSVEDLLALRDIVKEHTIQLKEHTEQIKTQTKALEQYAEEMHMNNRMTSQMYKDTNRNRILDFSHKLLNDKESDKPIIYSREEFNKIHEIYQDYEKFLETYGGTNGQVDRAMQTIEKAENGELGKSIKIIENLR